MFNKLKEQWRKFPIGIKLFIEFLFSISVLLGLYGIYFILIPKDLAVKDEYINWIAIFASVITIWGFIKSWEAASKSSKIETDLIEEGVISLEIKEGFKNIFNEHFIKKIDLFKNSPGNIYLSLSTPAYGYGVLGRKECKKLHHSLEMLHSESQIELILFSPDAHYNYWANLIFWSLDVVDENFMNDFALLTYEIIDTLSTKKCLIWLKKETTVRFFAYEPLGDPKKAGNPKKAFVSLVDSISIYQNQFGSDFNARSLPIQRNQIKEFINGSSSFFHRIKSCPYTFRINEDAALKFGGMDNEENKKLAKFLKWDFILGRTSYNHYPDKSMFKDECKFFIANRGKEHSDKEDIVYQKILLGFFNYYKYINEKYSIVEKRIISDKQHKQIIDALKKITDDDFKDIKEYFFTEDIDNTAESQEETKDNLWIDLLYDVLTAGFGESKYAKEIKKIDKNGKPANL